MGQVLCEIMNAMSDKQLDLGRTRRIAGVIRMDVLELALVLLQLPTSKPSRIIVALNNFIIML